MLQFHCENHAVTPCSRAGCAGILASPQPDGTCVVTIVSQIDVASVFSSSYYARFPLASVACSSGLSAGGVMGISPVPRLSPTDLLPKGIDIASLPVVRSIVLLGT